MSLVLVTPPASLAADPWQVKEQLHLDPVPQDDSYVETLIEAAVARLDAKAGILGICLLTQTWKLTLPAFPTKIVLPLPPHQSVDSITYIDTAGAEQTLAAEDYQVFHIHQTINPAVPDALQATYGTAYSPEPAVITPVTGKSWPSTKDDHLEAVSVTFTAGFGEEFPTLPKQIQQAIAMDVAWQYEQREAYIVGQAVTEVPMGYQDLIAPYRQWSF